MANHKLLSMEDAHKLTQEWREGIKERLADQDKVLASIQKDIVDIKLTTATTASLVSMETRVRKLEDFQLKALTIIGGVQALVTFIGLVVMKVLFKN